MIEDIQISSFIEESKTGLRVIPNNTWLDARRVVDEAVVSHAHADHFNPGVKKIHCTPNTANLAIARYGSRLRSELIIHDYESQFSIGNVKYSFHPAGHMLGSAQVLMEYKGLKFLYTGDFKLRNDESCEAFSFVECDVLITESTYAKPEKKHPDIKEALKKLNSFEDSNILIGSYVMGKAQSISRILHDHKQEKIRIHPDILPYHKSYEKAGIYLGAWKVYDRHELKEHSKLRVIVPPAYYHSYPWRKNTVKFFASGWDHYGSSGNHVLSVSDHADWDELMELIKKSGASRVMSVHGEGDNLHRHIGLKSFRQNIL